MIENYLDIAARNLVLEQGKRVDGRGLDEIRPLEASVGVLARTHGTGLFRRGETQVLSVVTLGSPGMEQTLDGMEEDGKKRFMHHYNFPGFSVGEVRPVRSPGRREIGHGALAEKALVPVIPQDRAKFPYTIRIVSEVLSSNGSSSQASICGSSLALMDAGVPIKAAVAGIAMGLITDPADKSRYAILTDIQGVEDHSGDMDFKVAGTANGVTAVQLDIKLGGIAPAIISETLAKAKTARNQVLEVMSQAIGEPRPELSPYAPRIVSFNIPVDKIRDVIGPGGKIINEIIDATGVTIDIEDDGLVMVTSVSAEASQKAVDWIKNLTREVVIGETFQGKVTRLMNFGAFVEVLPRQEGLVHVSELSWNYVNNVTDVVKIGDIIVATSAFIDEGTSRHYGYNEMSCNGIALPSFDLTETVKGLLRQSGVFFNEGPVWSTDAIYRETPEKIACYKEKNALGVEMELSAIYSAAAFRNIEAAGVLVVSDEISTLAWRPGFNDTRFRESRTAACGALIKICQSL